ncbi:hypothetical protein Plhal703r1_c05g0029941 [Plasmopara halstedii]
MEHLSFDYLYLRQQNNLGASFYCWSNETKKKHHLPQEFTCYRIKLARLLKKRPYQAFVEE